MADKRTDEEREADRQLIYEIRTDGDDREAITNAAVAYVKATRNRQSRRGPMEQTLVDVVNKYNSRPWRR